MMLKDTLWMKIPTTWAKFLLILLPILVTSALAYITIFAFTKQAQLHENQQNQIITVADRYAATLASKLANHDQAGIRAVMHVLSVLDDITCVDISSVTNPEERVLWPASGCDSSDQQSSVTQPIRLEERTLGHLTLTYSHLRIESQLRGEILTTIWLVSMLLVLNVITALFAHRLTISTPLTRLIDSIRQAEQKGSRQLVEWQSGDELGKLIASYNRLLVKLAFEEVRLRKSEERLTLAIAATRSSVWDRDLTSGSVWWSAEFPAILGYSNDELTMSAATLESLIHPDDLNRVLSDSLRHIMGETTSYSNVYRLRCKDGRYRWVEDKATAIRDDSGVATRLTGILADNTERKQAEIDLAHERAILQATLENVDQGIVMFDQNLQLVTFNRRAAEYLNVPLKVLTQRPTFDEIIRCQQERGEFSGPGGAERLSQLLDQSATDYFTIKHRRTNGTVIEIRSNPLFQGGFVCTYTDVTAETQAAEETVAAMQEAERAYAELKQTQASLVQAEKMASLGMLVAGIAHEINTPVGIAFSCASHLANRTQQLTAALETASLKKSDLTGFASAAIESTRLMSANLSRAADLIRSFKQVAVDQASAELRRFDLMTYVNEVVTSLGPHLRTTPHQVVIQCPPGITINSYPGALSQVLTNLVMNALVHAFDHKAQGTITLTIEQAADGSEVDLRFHDDGSGIPAALREKIFEPFFTTRRGSGGSGLGLHIVFNLVTQSLGGRISVESAEGQGTTFLVRLPREVPPRKEAAPAEPAA